jgi:hypothetical protein
MAAAIALALGEMWRQKAIIVVVLAKSTVRTENLLAMAIRLDIRLQTMQTRPTGT